MVFVGEVGNLCVRGGLIWFWFGWFTELVDVTKFLIQTPTHSFPSKKIFTFHQTKYLTQNNFSI